MSHLSVIVPMRDEANRLREHLPRLFRWCRARGAELVLCDDGSHDGTLESSRTLALSEGVVPVCLRLDRKGKGAAVASGLLAASGEVRIMIDADVPVEMDDVDRIVERARDCDGIVIGVRGAVAGDRTDGSRMRRILSWASTMVSRGLLGGIEDSQCGCKAWSAPTAKRLCDHRQVDGFAFDFEQIFCARKLGVRVNEIRISWSSREGSHVRPIVHGTRFVLDVLRVVWIHRHLVAKQA
ncbi:MAG: hypothetical protein RL173_591 [Fibrobacterota bacterium]|jgi:glycosyltransferase involved in cell wall biosynthesis